MLFPISSKVKPSALLLGLLLLIMPALAACGEAEETDVSLSGVDAETAEDAVKVGVLVISDIDTTRDRYEPLMQNLGNALGQPVLFVPLPFESQLLMVEEGSVDFVITNPLTTAQMRQLHGTEILATLSRPETGAVLAGSIIVSPDSPIGTVADLRDKTGACVSMKTAAAGCLFQMLHLQENGINPYTEVFIQEIDSQDDIVQAVLDGEVEFGFVRMDQTQRMVERGQLSSVEDVRVLDPIQSEAVPLPHTTQAYPAWAVPATADVPAELAESMQQALLNLPEGSDALVSADVAQILPAADYGPIETLIETMGLDIEAE